MDMPPHGNEWQGQPSYSHALGVSSSAALAIRTSSTVLPVEATGARWGQLSGAPKPVRGRAGSVQSLNIPMWSQSVAQPRYISMFSSDNMNLRQRHQPLPVSSHGPRRDPQWQLGLEHHYSPRLWSWSLTTGSSSLLSSLQFRHSSSCSNCSSSLFLPFVHHIIAHFSGSCCR